MPRSGYSFFRQIGRGRSRSTHLIDRKLAKLFLVVVFACAMSLGMAKAADYETQGVKAFLGATLIDGTGVEPKPDTVIIVVGDRVDRVGRTGEIDLPVDIQKIDVAGKWVIPGLIDAHVHFFQSASLYTRPDVIDLRRVRPYEQEIAWIRERIPQTLARYIASGVTSVADLAGPVWTFEVREQAAGPMLSPNQAVAGPGLAPMMSKALITDDPPGVIVRTPGQARDQVRRLLAREPDLLKIWFPYRPGMELDQEMQWVRLAVDEAHSHGVRVAAHATQSKLARAMVEAGVDILVHSVDDKPVNQDFVDLLKARDTLYITTLMVGEGYQEVLGQKVMLTEIERRAGDPEVIASFERLRQLLPWIRGMPVTQPSANALRNLKTLHGAGVTVVAGSDAGNIGTLHGPALHRELELMQTAGLAPAGILVAATLGGAKLMGREDQLGIVEPGKLADFVILDADPLKDISNTQWIYRVVKSG